MSEPSIYRDITRQGLWKNNAALVQLLGLCPLLAVSASVVNALGLGLATLAVLTLSSAAVSIIRSQISDAIRLPTFVMIIAAVTTCIELLMRAYTYDLYQVLGIFIPLIVTNCTVLGRAESFASKNPLLPSIIDGFMMGLGFALVLLTVGAIRELLGNGTLLMDMHLLLGEAARSWKIQVFSERYPGFLLAILPPGAFIVTGFLIALKNLIDQWQKESATRQAQPVIKGSKRVRSTGIIQ